MVYGTKQGGHTDGPQMATGYFWRGQAAHITHRTAGKRAVPAREREVEPQAQPERLEADSSDRAKA